MRKMAVTQTQGKSPLILFLALLGFCTFGSARSGKLLVVPVDGSRWNGIKAVAEELSQKGHMVTVVIPEVSMQMGPSNFYTTKTYPVPYTKEYLKSLQDAQGKNIFSQKPFLEKITSGLERIQNMSHFFRLTCESLLYNKELMNFLREQEFDAILTDPVLPIGVIVAEYLSLPSVYLLRGIPCGLDFKATMCPSPPSYVPRFFTKNTDQMTFPQRVLNVFVSVVEPVFCKLLYFLYDDIASAFLQRGVTVAEMMSRASVWLMRFDFTLEHPRPLMPNMVLIGGINCAVKKLLPLELETFVNSSGEHGFVVFTLGSMVSEMPMEKVNVFVEAFRRIPQKVLWRYTGPIPDNLPDNIKIMKWLPQNDLLGHPKARAFITHGGTHGIYEGICNGVPMVMLPLFGDQSDNAHRMEARGVGVVLSINQITTEVLLEAVNKVINNKSYKEKMTKLSALHRDRPVEPMDLAVFWTEFVMRHKGAQHLRPAAHELNWIQYHSLDVIGLLITIVVVLVIVTVRSCAFCFRKCCCKKPSLKNKSD
ncbi:UDP-glucuronosyltransferase 1A1-like isoform X2 [Lepisosteus oculatus]|uniref:UDP-glucuronosyltransferase 1A1-like isoform X2 n=1 Tax=Lepisosteus oculatus TaxID=7918 RepID=UPI0035F50EAE